MVNYLVSSFIDLIVGWRSQQAYIKITTSPGGEGGGGGGVVVGGVGGGGGGGGLRFLINIHVHGFCQDSTNPIFFGVFPPFEKLKNS